MTNTAPEENPMTDPTRPALDDVADADELAGDPVTAEHDLDPTTFAQETDDE